MLSRRHLRIKVLQALYAFKQSDNDNLTQGEKQLITSIDKLYELYVHQLSFLVELARFAEQRIEESKNKLLPTLNASLSTKKQYGQDGDPLLKRTNLFAGLTFNFPLYQRDAKGSYGIAVNKYSQLTVQKNYLSQQLHVTLEKILSEQQADQQRLALINKEVALAKKIERAERIRFNAGDSSLFLVNQREQTTFSLEILACQIMTEFKLALLQLEALEGFLK